MVKVYNNQTSNGQDCFKFPKWVSDVPQLPFVILQMQMLVIFCVTQLLHQLFFKRAGLPPLVSQLLAGIIVGPSVLGRINGFSDSLFPPSNFSVSECIVLFNYMLSLFIIATKMDFTILRRTGKKVLLIGLLSLSSSLIANAVTVKLLRPDEKTKGELSIATTSLPITAHPVLVRLITDIGLANSELGRLALATGLCVEIASIMLTMGMNNILPALDDRSKLFDASFNMLGVVSLLITIIFILRPFLRLLVRMTPKDRPVKETYVLLAFLAMLIGSLFTNFVGQFVLLGAFMVGGGLPDGPPLGSALVEKFDSLISGVLYPFFLSMATARINFASINFDGTLVYHLAILMAVTSVTKLSVCFICGVSNMLSYRDALALAFLMCAKGFLEIATFTWLNDLKALSLECFTLMCLYVIVMATVVPVAVNILYDPMRKYGGYQIRDIMHLRENANLRIVACILRSDNISTVTNLLTVLGPTREAPITAQILHLIKLAGRCQPLFISHDDQKKQSSKRSYSDEIIFHFDRLQEVKQGMLNAHVFTVLTQPKAMHEYICTMSLDKVASLIVLPFHRKYNIEGSIYVDDHEQRILNTSVLATSPSSVAVIVDRGHVKHKQIRKLASVKGLRTINVVTETTKPLLSVAVIFIGGNDDSEAVAFAKRMNKGMKIRLTIIRLAAPNDGEEFLQSQDSKILEKLNEAKYCGQNQIMYMQATVKDGIETAFRLRTLVHEYDLMIVGRRFGLDCPQTAGLLESSEIKELGILGDLLASPNLKCNTSILVVQQQQHYTLGK